MDDNPIISCNNRALYLPVRFSAAAHDAQRSCEIRRKGARFRWSAVPATIPGLLVLLLLFPGVVLCKSEMRQIRGRVVDASTDKGLPFANIFVENTGNRANTNREGDFHVLLPRGGSKLVVSYVGYKTTAVKAQPAGSPLLIRLSPVGYRAHEVDVVANRIAQRMENSFTLEHAEIADFSGITRDPMRAIQLMPGVSNDDEASAKMDVRGGTWDENTVLIDGAEIHDPYHLKEVSLASLGIFNEDVVKSIGFSPGGFGAQYGDALSSVMDIRYREGNRKHFEGSVNLSPLDLSASLEGPVSRQISFIVAARGSYLGYMLKDLDISRNVYGGYYDIQGDAAYHPDERGKLQLDFLYSEDNAVESPFHIYSVSSGLGTVSGKNTEISRTVDETAYFGGHYSNSLLSLSYHDALSDDLSSNTLIYYTRNIGYEDPTENTVVTVRYGSLPNLWTNQHAAGNETYNLLMTTLSFGERMKYDPLHDLSFDAGVGIRRMYYNYKPDMFSNTVTETNVTAFPDTTVSVLSAALVNHDTTALAAESYELNGFIQQRLRLTDNLELTPGIRFDYFDLDREGRVSPRINLRYLAPPGVELTAAWGVYYQIPSYDQLRMSEASSANTQFQKATEYILGFEKSFSARMNFRIQLYQKYYSDLVPVIRTPYGGLFYGTKENDGSGFARGVDCRYTAHFRHFDLWVSYSYLVAKEKKGQDSAYYPRLSDQTNTASIGMVYKPAEDWIIDIRGFYGSGYAYTPYIAVMDSATMLGSWVEGAPNSAHYPAYERLDVRITKMFRVMESPLELFIDITNVFNRKNVWGYRYTYDKNGDLQAEPMTLLGIVPAIGISYRFGL